MIVMIDALLDTSFVVTSTTIRVIQKSRVLSELEKKLRLRESSSAPSPFANILVSRCSTSLPWLKSLRLPVSATVLEKPAGLLMYLNTLV
jgi:hypothetical protein